MSVWQRPQLSLVMKKFAGMVRCTFVSPDEGKNGLEDPAPSSFIDAGTIDGLRMMFVFFARADVIVAAHGAATRALGRSRGGRRRGLWCWAGDRWSAGKGERPPAGKRENDMDGQQPPP